MAKKIMSSGPNILWFKKPKIREITWQCENWKFEGEGMVPGDPFFL
jgi:hypothetical protein